MVVDGRSVHSLGKNSHLGGQGQFVSPLIGVGCRTTRLSPLPDLILVLRFDGDLRIGFFDIKILELRQGV